MHVQLVRHTLTDNRIKATCFVSRSIFSSPVLMATSCTYFYVNSPISPQDLFRFGCVHGNIIK